MTTDPVLTDPDDHRLAGLSEQRRTLARTMLGRQRQTSTTPSGGRGSAAEPARAVDLPPRAETTDIATRSAPLQSSLFLFAAEDAGRAADIYRFVLDCARFADVHGFESLWIPERHFDPFGGPYPNPAVLAAAVAVVTERLKIRAGSVVLPLRDPITVAEEWAMVQSLAPGRIGVALASGWHPDDFVLSPDTFERRRNVLAEGLDLLCRLWAGERVKRVNGAGRPVDIATFPRVAEAPPLWLTSSSNEETWRRAARAGCNVLTGLLEQDLATVARLAAVYREERSAAGHDPDAGHVTLMVHTFMGESADDVNAAVEVPLSDYLMRHLGLFAKLTESSNIGIDPGKVTEADRRTLVRFGVQRYINDHGLFGTPETCAARARAFREAGVDEVAHLIDFGLPFDSVLGGLSHLDRFRRLMAGPPEADHTPQDAVER